MISDLCIYAVYKGFNIYTAYSMNKKIIIYYYYLNFESQDFDSLEELYKSIDNLYKK